MKWFISIGVLIVTLGGWCITYEPFGIWFPLDSEGNPPPDYWYWFDIPKSATIFLLSLWAFCGKLNAQWRHIAIIQIIYFGVNLAGDIIGVNEKGNWFTYLTGAIFIYLIAITFFPKWAYSKLFLPQPKQLK